MNFYPHSHTFRRRLRRYGAWQTCHDSTMAFGRAQAERHAWALGQAGPRRFTTRKPRHGDGQFRQ